MRDLELIPQNFDAIFAEAKISDHLSSIAMRMLNSPEAFVKSIMAHGDWFLYLADKATEAEVKLEGFLQIEKSAMELAASLENVVTFRTKHNINGADHYTRNLGGDDDGGRAA